MNIELQLFRFLMCPPRFFIILSCNRTIFYLINIVIRDGNKSFMKSIYIQLAQVSNIKPILIQYLNLSPTFRNISLITLTLTALQPHHATLFQQLFSLSTPSPPLANPNFESLEQLISVPKKRPTNFQKASNESQIVQCMRPTTCS